MRIFGLTKQAAVLGLALVLGWTAVRWLVVPFAFQAGVRQELAFLCQETPACASVAAVKVFNRETGAIERRVTLRLAAGSTPAARKALATAAGDVIEAAIGGAPAWQRAAMAGMLPLEMRHE